MTIQTVKALTKNLTVFKSSTVSHFKIGLKLAKAWFLLGNFGAKSHFETGMDFAIMQFRCQISF